MKRSFLATVRGVLAICAILPTLTHAVDQSVLVAAQNMLNSGQSLEALDLLQPHEEEYAGHKDYDYLYGLALLDTGDPADAVFAFQRALAVAPNFAGARLELARSYYDMGQMQRAHREFTILQSQAPPKNVIDVIEKYMAAIESRNLRNRRGWRGFLQLGIGDDSNANSATASESFLGFDLSANSRETSSSVVSTFGGATYDLPISYASKLFFKGSINHRSNNEASFTSTVNYELVAGYNRLFSNHNELSTEVQVFTADVDGELNNRGFNLTAQYNFNLSNVNQLGAFARIGQVDYATEFDARDIDQSLLGASFAHVFAGRSRVSLVSAALAGQDEADSTSPYSRDFTGLRVSLAYPVTHRFNLFTSLGSTESDYTGTAFFGGSDSRSDTTSDLAIGGSWRASKTWLLRAVVSQVDNSSNIELFDYQRTQFMLTARSEFMP